MASGEKDSQVQTLDPNAKPVAMRLPNVAAARAVFSKYRQASIVVAAKDAKVIALRRNVPPYRDKDLIGLGQGWRANLNMGEMKGAINNRADAAYNLHMELPTRIKVAVRPEYKEMQSPNPLLDYGQIIAEEYTYTLNNDWPDNYFVIDQVTRDRIAVGLGLTVWQDHLDWRPKQVPKFSFFTDPQYPPLAHKIPACCLRDTLPLSKLLAVLDISSEAAKAAGWKRDIVRKVVLEMWQKTDTNSGTEPPAARDDIVGRWAAFEAWRASKPADVAVFELTELPVIRTLIVGVGTEKVSHYIDIDPSAAVCETDDFLFYKQDQFGTMGQALWLNPYSYSEGTTGSLDGLGHDLAPYAEMSNRMICQALDGGTVFGGLLLQAQQGFDADEASVIRMGPTTVIPPTLEAVTSSFTPPIEKVLDLRSAIRGVFANNVGMTRMNPEMMEQAKRGTRSTAEISMERHREFNIENNSANFEYLMWTFFHREVFRRLVKASKLPKSVPGAKEARAFVNRCLKRNVPKALFAEFEEALVVEADRMVGGGSPQARAETWSSLMDIRGDMDEAGRRHTQREYAAALIGYQNVDSVFPLRGRDQIPTNELSIAFLENNQFAQGQYIPAGSDQLHTVHLVQAHFKLLGGMAKTYAENPENADLQAILRTFSAALPHCGEHVQFLARDETRAPIVNQFMELMREYTVLYRRVEKQALQTMTQRQRLEQQRQQQVIQQLEQQMNGETQAKIRKIELDAQLEAMKQESIAQVRQVKTDAQNEIRASASEAKAALDRDIAERRMALEEEMARRQQDLKETTTRK